MKIIQSLIVGSMLSLMACEKWQIEKLPQKPADLVVVTSILSPQDSLITVYVGKGIGIEGNPNLKQDLSRSNAIVSLSDGSKTVILPFDTLQKRYQLRPSAQFKIEANNTYSLSVLVEKNIYTSTCQIPPDIENAILGTNFKEDKIILSLKWKDARPNKKYFTFDGLCEIDNLGIFISRNYASWNTRPSPLLEIEEKGAIFFEQMGNIGFAPGRPLPPKVNVVCEILSYDENYALYLKSVVNSGDTPQTSVDFLEKFKIPKIRYSNIKNGVGVMVGLNKKILQREVIF